MRSSWWQCLALAWTCWIQGIRHRVPQCLLSSRHRKASYQQHNSQGKRTLWNSYCCCLLGHFRNHKQVSAQRDCSLPASTLLLILHYQTQIKDDSNPMFTYLVQNGIRPTVQVPDIKPKVCKMQKPPSFWCYCWDKFSDQILQWEVACSAEATCGI